jgi:serine phosphatase RsbU (regulator of sigma subunit)/catechol 2,3-dioxygenase-like lactoylglutathione lyase family enzyme
MGNSHPRPDVHVASVGTERQDPYLRLQSVSIFVRDLDRSVRFYVDQLGFNLVLDGRVQAGRRWVAVSPPDGTATLTLVAPEPDTNEHKLIGRSTQVAFVTEDVLAKFREWRRRGVQFLNTPRLRRLKLPLWATSPGSTEPSTTGSAHAPIWGGVFTRFKDLDGNSFSLVSFDELSREIEEQRRAAATKLEAERRSVQELEIARQVQARLFPQALPPLRTLQYAGACIQARQVGGDYYDFLQLGGDRVGFVVGDICGKGIAAALLMANLQANLRSQCAVAIDQPERLLQSVNQLFCENTGEGSFATLFFAEYDDHLQRVRYASCGHLSALLLRSDDRLERLDSTCTVLGLFRDWDCAVAEERLFAGDTLALYTDGVTESFNDAGEEFGEERLVDALRRHRKLPPRDLLTSIVGDVQQFSPREQHDDITLIIAKCQA